MKLRKIIAIFKKLIMDTAYNTNILIQFLIYPLIIFLFIFIIPSDTVLPKMSLVMTLSTMYTGMMPILIVSNIIREDKYTNTLRMMIMSTVKPQEYLIGINAYILFVSLISSFIIGIVGGFDGLRLLLFIGILISGIVTSILLGRSGQKDIFRKWRRNQ